MVDLTDAQLIVEYIDAHGAQDAHAENERFDTNRDGYISAIDALAVVKATQQLTKSGRSSYSLAIDELLSDEDFGGNIDTGLREDILPQDSNL